MFHLSDILLSASVLYPHQNTHGLVRAAGYILQRGNVPAAERDRRHNETTPCYFHTC